MQVSRLLFDNRAKRILLAEDEAELGTWLVKALAQNDFQVDWVNDGRLVRRCLKTTRYALILDLGLPGLGGHDVLSDLREADERLPVLILSARDSLMERVSCLHGGADDFLGNVILLVLNIPRVGVFTKVLSVPNWLLVPGIVAVSSVGVYAVHATTFDLVLMTVLGFAAYLLRKQGVPMAPLILGFVLGDMMEQNLRRALSISNGNAGILVGSPITIGLWVAAALMLVVPIGMRLLAARNRSKAVAARHVTQIRRCPATEPPTGAPRPPPRAAAGACPA